MKKTTVASALAVFLFPFAAHAQVVVSEIMYDLADGSDTGREWIEVFNGGVSSVDLTTWKLFEADTNHKITEVSGGTTLSSGAYAIIADNAAKFLTDHPSYSGLLFDSTFSLNNAGETLILRDQDLADKDSISYTPAMGAAGDGNTLNRQSVSGKTFSAAASTPGTGTLEVAQTASAPSENTSSSTSTSPTLASASMPAPEAHLFAYAGLNRTVIVGADTVFEGQALNKDGEVIEPTNVRFLWTFGDGSTAEGRSVFHHFAYPGNYVVMLDVSSGGYGGTTRILVAAQKAALALSALEGSAVIENKAGREIDLSFWHVQSGVNRFRIPEKTVVLKGEKIIIPHAILGFAVGTDWKLLYPNGTAADSTTDPMPHITHEAVFSETPLTASPAVAPQGVTRSVPRDSQVAAAAVSVGTTTPKKGKSGSRWLFGFGALLLLGGVGAFVATHLDQSAKI